MRHRLLTSGAVCALVAACSPKPPPPIPSLTTVSQQLAAASPADSLGCLDTLIAKDSISVAVRLSVRPQDPKVVLPVDFEELFAEEFASRFKVPARVPLSVVVGVSCPPESYTCRDNRLWLSTTAYGLARTDGSLSDVRLLDESLTPTLAETMGAVLESISRDRAIPLLPGVSLPLRITLRVDTPDSVGSGRTLFRLRMPRYVGEFSRPTFPKNFTPPRYPRSAERAGIADTIVMSYTVMRDGRIDPQSLDLQRGRYQDFIPAVLTSIEKTTYQPARLEKCPVAAWTPQTFMFLPHP